MQNLRLVAIKKPECQFVRLCVMNVKEGSNIEFTNKDAIRIDFKDNRTTLQSQHICIDETIQITKDDETLGFYSFEELWEQIKKR